MCWLLLILTLPTENATARMRVWRSLKNAGAAALRDGVYVLPALANCRATFTAVADEVQENGGSVYLVNANGEDDEFFQGLFNRTAEFTQLLIAIQKSRADLTADTLAASVKQSRRLRKTFTQLLTIDFFPSEARKQTAAALSELEQAIQQTLSPDEPHSMDSLIPQCVVADYQGRIWATRTRPRADRLASAWLIRRFIDADAVILWLNSPLECPADALGFDFDGAAFSHIGAKVTFETLLAGFEMASPALNRLAGIVHFLDVGGIPSPEAQGIERVLAGLCETLSDDNQLLATACIIFDALLTSFEKDLS